MDRLPYGSGGFLLFQDSVVPQGIEPYPQDFQSCVQTTYTREPIMIMLEYPSRSNLNCLIVVLRGLGRGCRILEPILDCRHPRDRENHYHWWKIVDSNHSREDLIYSQVAVSERLLLPNLYLVVESNHFPLHVKQIRFRYANKVKCMFLNFPLINIQTKCIRAE